MAPADRPAAEHLSFLARGAATVRRWGLFPLVRGAEARAPHLPRVGRAKLPSQDIVDLRQTPALSLAQTTLDKVDVVRGRARVSGYWLGLTGPMGALPLHLTEFAVYEARYAKTRPFGGWLDVLAGRMLQLFYRAWADSQPVTSLDREEDPFGRWLGALSGAPEGVSAQSPFPPRARLHYAALYASRRSAGAIEGALSHLMGQPVQLLEFQPRWRDIEREDRTRVGQAFATLGGDAVLGGRIRTATDAFRVVIEARSFRDYKTLLPTGERFAVAAAALDAFAPSHLEWDMALGLREDEIRPARLDGQTQLGWTGWMSPPAAGRTVRQDAHLQRQKRRYAMGGSKI